MDINKNSISFVLDNIQNYQTIADEASLSSSVFILDSSKDVLSQIAAITAQYGSLDAIHLFSHGSSGELNLGSITLNSQTLQNYHEILAQIGTSLSDNGDILLYGCNVASGANGIEFISKLSQATGADIAASDDVTGNSAKGGNWILETASGSVETSALAASGFGGVLAPSGSPVYDFEGPTNAVNSSEVDFTTNNHTLQTIADTSVAYITPGYGNNYLQAVADIAPGKITLKFTDGAVFNAQSIDIARSSEDSVHLHITSDVSDNGYLDVWSNNISTIDSNFTSINLSQFEGATELYIAGWSGGTIPTLYIDNVTVDFPVANAAPENTILASYFTNEDVKKHINDLAVADSDNDTLTVTLSVDHGVLNLSGINTADGIIGIDSDGLDGSVSFTGSVDDINTMLSEDGVDFYSLPNENGSPYATLTMTTSDGTDTDSDTATINVSAVSDTPTFEQGGSYYDSDEDYTFDTKDSILQPDGKLVFTVIKTSWDADESYLEVIRLNADGTPDDTFGDEGVAEFEDWYFADSIALQPDGKIIVIGMDTNDDIYLARLNADGSADSFSNDSANDDGFINVSSETGLDDLFMSKALIQPDGKIVLVGIQNSEDNDGGDTVLIRYNSDGTLDTDFGDSDGEDGHLGYVVQDYGKTSPNGAEDAVLLANGKIIVAGAMDDEDGTLMAVACFDTDGSLDTDFGTNGIATLSFGDEDSISEANAIAIDADGKIVIAGYTDATVDGNLDVALARFNADGTVDNTFGTSGKAILTSIHDVDFSADEDAINGDDWANDITIDASGNIYVASSFNYKGDARYDEDIDANYTAMAKYDSNGVLDTTFGASGILIPEYIMEGYMDDGDDAALTSILVQPDGKIVNIGWDYDEWWGGGFFAERIDSDGNQDMQFNANWDTVSYARTYSYKEGSLDYVTIGGRGNPPVVFDVEQHAEDNYLGGELTISRDGGANAEDIIRLDSTGLAEASVSLDPISATTGNIKYGGSTLFATYDHTTDGQLKIIFGAGSTQALVDAITANISYRNTNTLNPAYDEGEVELSWIYNDGDEQETTSSCYISIEGDDDGGIEGTVSVVGSSTTGTTLTIAGLDTITDPDLVTDENEGGTVLEEDLSFQWQVSTDGITWNNITSAYSDTFTVTADENGKQIRVVIESYDPTSDEYSELASSIAVSGGGSSGSSSSGGGNSGGGSTPTTPTTPPSTTTTVDGATVQTTTTTQTRTTTDANGHTTATTVSTEKIVIAPVTSTRAEQTGNATTADVPLFWGESSRTEWATTASIPTGVGLTSEGSRAPAATQTKATAIDDLIYYIDTTAPSTDSSKTTMLGGGETFLQALSNIETLVVNKITLSATTIQASQAPITITGVANTISTANGAIAPQEALVIDAQTLPSHSTLQLQNVEFAVIIGEDLTIRGGEGKNILFSGAGSQDIMLGEDDDELHAGAGDDTVGSAGGDDKIFGEAGNDTVFGGEGDDLLHGGSETDIATYSGNMADYIITRDEGKTYVALASNPNEIDTLINVETITFADSSYTVESTAVHEKIATLYTQVFDRQADIDGFQYWAHNYNDGLSLGGLVVSFMKIADSSWSTKNTSEQIEMLYEYVIGHSSDVEGKNYWINDIQNNHMTIENVAECFIDLLGQYQLKDDWDFSL